MTAPSSNDAITDLRRAIARTEERLAAMAAELGPDQCPCCVGAAYGGTHGPYDKLERKRDRQEAWLAVMVARAAGDKSELARASERYGKMVIDHYLCDHPGGTTVTVRGSAR